MAGKQWTPGGLSNGEEPPTDGLNQGSARGWQPDEGGHGEQQPGSPDGSTATKPGLWRRFRNLHIAVQLTTWTIVVFIALGVVGEIVGPAKTTTNASAHSAKKAKAVKTTVPKVTTSTAELTTSTSTLATTTSVPITQPSAPAATAPAAPPVTGFGATIGDWNESHSLDTTVPAHNAYLPRLNGSTDDTWQVVMVNNGRVDSYTINVTPSSLAAAENRARQELPSDAKLLWTRTVAGTCSQEQFQSATLNQVLGDGQVNVEFDNAVSATDSPVTEALFSTYDASTTAQAPAC